MIDEIGHFALVLALCVAVIQATVPLYGAAKGDGALIALARPAALAQFAFIAAAFFALMHAYATSDFSMLNVAANSSSAKPLLYKITGVWSNHEGSMILWVFMLALFGAAVAVFSSNLPPALRARVLAVQAMI
ncbi:MAG TPA: heme lyase NrfEFG subunit NrfE, partial [Stellaceae bacterium]|nr:heme lyase NrfEFG subunit NrfE [Stellaceae bacterium]